MSEKCGDIEWSVVASNGNSERLFAEEIISGCYSIVENSREAKGTSSL